MTQIRRVRLSDCDGIAALAKCTGAANTDFKERVLKLMRSNCPDFGQARGRYYSLSNGGVYLSWVDYRSLVRFDHRPTGFRGQLSPDELSQVINLRAFSDLCFVKYDDTTYQGLARAHLALGDYIRSSASAERLQPFIDSLLSVFGD